MSLEVSVRMAAGAVAELQPFGPGLVSSEHDAWRHDWGVDAAHRPDGHRPDGGGGEGEGRADPDGLPLWRRVSSLLRELAADNHGDVSPVEYAATALLRTLRVMAASAPPDEHRLRLLPYLSVLTTEIRRASDG